MLETDNLENIVNREFFYKFLFFSYLAFASKLAGSGVKCSLKPNDFVLIFIAGFLFPYFCFMGYLLSKNLDREIAT